MNTIKTLMILLAAIIGWSTGLQAQGVAINEADAAPDASAILDVSSTTKGLLLPRMTSSERTAVSSPAKGLLVYDTNHNALFHYNGQGWQQLSAVATGSQDTDVPDNPYIGQLYLDTADEKLFIYVSSGWAEVPLAASSFNIYP